MPARKKSSGRAASKSPSKRPIRREIGALICFFLSIFIFLGLFGVRAVLIDFVCAALRSAVGRGFWAVPFILITAAVALLFHRGKPVALRITCLCLFPLAFGSLLHVFTALEALPFSWELPGLLITEGINSEGGGLLGGLLAISLGKLLSAIGAAIVLIVGIAALVFCVLRLSPVKLYDNFRSRQRAVYVPEPAPEPAPLPAPPKRGKRSEIDVPLYGTDIPAPVPEIPVTPAGQLRPPDVKTPAEALAQQPKPVPIPQVFYFEDKAPVIMPEEIERPDFGGAPDREPEEPPAAVIAPPTAVAAPPERETEKPAVPAQSAHPMPYQFPPVSLLTGARPGQVVDASEELKANAVRLIEVLADFGIGASIITVTRGPSVTRYEIELESGVKLSRLTGLSDDIALALGAPGVNISPVQNKMSVVGVEVPNKLVTMVYIRDLVESTDFKTRQTCTSFVIGRDIGGQNITADIAKLTHLLIAGSTGSGKSVCMNTLITSMLYKASPDRLKFIMVDPKMVELGIYNGIPHLLQPVVTDPKKAASALDWAVVEMDSRYNKLLERKQRDIDSYNEAIKNEPGVEPMPRIVIIIDEMADLMMVAKKEIETSVARIAQKARACGVHLILATQRPTAQVVTGIIKANIPSRIAFSVASGLDSRIILDTTGAEKLVGRGDMLYFPVGAPKPQRVQGCFISSEEVERVVSFISRTGEPQYDAGLSQHLEKEITGKNGNSSLSSNGEEDSMLPVAIEVIIEAQQGSTSFLQRRLSLGYSRAAKLMDLMEERGIVGPFEGSKPRKVLITPAQWEQMKGTDDQ